MGTRGRWGGKEETEGAAAPCSATRCLQMLLSSQERWRGQENLRTARITPASSLDLCRHRAVLVTCQLQHQQQLCCLSPTEDTLHPKSAPRASPRS